jgi:putative transposase
MPDHAHIFIGYNVNQLIPDLVENIKTSSNEWIKTDKLSKLKFEWQKGYGAFSHSRSQLDTVVKYVLTQEQHHKKKSFRSEYLEMLRKNDIAFKDEYIFDFFEDGIDWG